MQILRFSYKRNQAYGIKDKDIVKILKYPPFEKIKFSGNIELKKIKLIAPSLPSKIVLVGLNYHDHAKELNMNTPHHPIIFLKPPTTLIAHNDSIIYPKISKRVDFEAELALVIKKEAKNISAQDAKKYILGYTCLNDVTARDLQKKDVQWSRAKSFDTFCPCGPWIETELNPANLKIKSYLNNELKQNSSTKNFIFSIPEVISFISKTMTLLPGDIISTGTPPGIGPMRIGDKIEVEIEGIGRLTNQVVS